MKETTADRIERIFRDLDELIKNGKFSRQELDFMELFLTATLEGTKIIARADRNRSNI